MSFHGTELVQSGIIPQGIESITTATRDVIERVSEPALRHPIHTDLLTFETFVSAIKKWKESTSTSTSPSGRHLGHYKSLLAIDSKSCKYTKENPDPGPELLRVLYHIAVSAFQSGITLSQWTNIKTCMIEKIPGTPKLNTLRVIHLYKAYYIIVNKLVWQRGVVWQEHLKGTLNIAQSGSRTYRTCIEVVVSKGQKYLYSQLTCTNIATLCYT